MKDFLNRLIPRYSRSWLVGIFCLNLAVYFGTRLFPRLSAYTDLTLGIDRYVPYVPAMILPYILAYPYWAVNYIMIARESRTRCKRVIGGEIIAKTICLICFIVFPTAFARPEATGSGLFPFLVKIIYRLDRPDNLFPSIHVLESWICWRGLIGSRRIPGYWKHFSFLFTLAVCASTVMVRQHVLIDIPGGILAAETGLLLSRLILGRKTRRNGI